MAKIERILRVRIEPQVRVRSADGTYDRGPIYEYKRELLLTEDFEPIYTERGEPLLVE